MGKESKIDRSSRDKVVNALIALVEKEFAGDARAFPMGVDVRGVVTFVVDALSD